MKISFVIPCYRSAGSIESVVSEIQATMTDADYEHEIVLVNDSSPDDTMDVLRRIASRTDEVSVVGLARNFGQHAALMAGFHVVSGDVIICLDDDGQTPPRESLKLLGKLDEGYDVVYGSYGEKKHSAFRNLGSALNERMARLLLDKPKGLYLSSYFAARRYVIDELKKYRTPYPYVIGLVLRTTNSIANVQVEHRARAEGVSGYRLHKLLSLWLNGFTAFSVKPLRVSSLTGVAVAALGLLFGVYTVIRRILDANIPLGWSSLMVAVLVIGGMILAALGMIGEYIGRVYISINQSPQFVVRERIDARHSDGDL
ncbi:MAG TPA: glycosyltransferase family 2 protein [Gryllotalpicola sp.]